MKHKDVGTELSKTEWEAGDTHVEGILIKTATYTISATDNTIICNKTTAMTINLPAASGSGKTYLIKSIGLGAVTIDGDSSDTIDGELTQIINQWEGLNIIDYAANTWVII
jgi:hypothetical protein